MGFDRNPMGSERFQSDPMVGWDGSTGEANQKSYSYLDQMSYESIFNDQSPDEQILMHGETLTHEDYIENVLPQAVAEDRRLLGDDFINQLDNATSHKNGYMIAWIEKIFS
ncbi:unnamed protein product [Rotaria socialis]|uniref:Uncharacterized protein n=2 Tax=Rotaria socialis TaxID=392032 RepID=A0A820XV45_9BILA|nr:unnamed protein product [Rotaria socialis]